MVDDEIRELDLIRANEYAEARGLSLGAADVVGRADAALGQQ
jgi:hypothetical protein